MYGRLALLLGIVLAACSEPSSDTGESCVPGEAAACACPSAMMGAQTCADDGMSFGECVCEIEDTDESTGTSGEGTDTDVESTGGPETTEGETDGTTEVETEGETEHAQECDGGVVNGDIDVKNDLDLNDLDGVVEVNGNLTIPPGLNLGDNLSCLRVVSGDLLIAGDYDYTQFESLKYVGVHLALFAEQPTMVGSFDSLELGEGAGLSVANLDIAGMPLVTSVAEVTSDRACVPIEVNAETAWITGPGCTTGTAKNLTIIDGPMPDITASESVTVAGAGVETLDGLTTTATLSADPSDTALVIQETSLASLDGINLTATVGSLRITDNPGLTDISALSGLSIEVSPGTWALVLTGEHSVCQAHFDDVTGTITTSGDLLFGGDC